MGEKTAMTTLEPSRVFYYFEQLSQIPRGSGNTRQISDYLVSFAADHGLSYMQDKLNNVVIYKEGAKAAPPVILQGHIDMVAEKRPGSPHDFEKDPLLLEVEGDWLTARDTTLGGDDGIAVAYMLAILESSEYEHPPLEAVFTVDEEIGLLGARGLDCSILKSKRMINLDSEEEGILWAGCAGGKSVQVQIPVKYVQAQGNIAILSIRGLKGGHSGAEIHKKRANAHLLMGRLLYDLDQDLDYEIAGLSGGDKDNVIPAECEARLVIEPAQKESFRAFCQKWQENIRREYAGSDEKIEVVFQENAEGSVSVLDSSAKSRLLFFLMQVPDGVHKFSGVCRHLVETSSNLGILYLDEDALYAGSGVRSSVDPAMDYLERKICFLAEFLGGEAQTDGGYPSWEYKEDSPLRNLMAQIYEEQYRVQPKIQAIHAGLECGVFYQAIPGLDCVSIGPDMKDIHTPEERLSISSTKRVFDYLLEVLRRLD